MKFKTIFLIFNVIIIVSFTFIFTMPLILFGSLKFFDFFTNNWPALMIFVAILVVFNTYFLSNMKLFSLLEEENWIDLITYLENQIYQKNNIYKNQVKILLNAYLVTSRSDGTKKLQTYLEQKKPGYIPHFSIPFSVPYLLGNEPSAGEKFFGKLLTDNKLKNRLWIQWSYGLSLMQQNQVEAGKKEFLAILDHAKDPVLILLSIYILKSFSKSYPEIKSLVENKAAELRKKFNVMTWKKMVEDKRSNVLILILVKILDQASEWLFNLQESEKPVSVH